MERHQPVGQVASVEASLLLKLKSGLRVQDHPATLPNVQEVPLQGTILGSVSVDCLLGLWI